MQKNIDCSHRILSRDEAKDYCSSRKGKRQSRALIDCVLSSYSKCGIRHDVIVNVVVSGHCITDCY